MVDLTEEEEIKDNNGSGRKEHQRMKSFLIYMYLMKFTDEKHPASGKDIAEYLNMQGIHAERRSIYKDIKELNIASLILEKDYTFEEAEEMIYGTEEDKGDEELAIIKYKPKKGFYVDDSRRPITPEDARLLAECVYHARFIPEGAEKRLLKGIFAFLTRAQRKAIKHNVQLVDRNATRNKETLFNVEVIDEAIKEGKIIEFQYLQYTIKSLDKQVERKKGGGKYVVSPYALLINEGNYYLLGRDESKKKVMTYRVDRITRINVTDNPREETEEYKAIKNDKGYTKRVFSMYGGRRENVEIRFINPLLDTVIDRFGTKKVQYRRIDENHFSVNTSVEVSEQFFGWLCGFGKRAKILYPDRVIKEFKEFLEKIQSNY